MTYKQLVAKVKEKLVLRAHEVVIKMSYQFPAWFELDEGNGSTPQYITDDEEVAVFIRMRRFIEEVDLCVSVVNKSCPKQASPPPPRRHWLRYVSANDDEDSESDSDDIDWHEFALDYSTPKPKQQSENQTNVAKEDIIMASVQPTAQSGIVIKEGGGSSRKKPTSSCARDKGKAVADADGEETSSDSDDNDFQIVPFSQPDNPMLVECSQARPRHNDPVTEGEPNRPPSDATSTGSTEGIGVEVEVNSVTMWGRVEEALHSMLSDMTDDPALFCRDAPPVFNDGKGEGVDTAISDIQYEGDKLFVGRVFKSKSDCKIKIAIHAINRKFHFRTSRSTPKFMVLKCISKSCPWCVYAAKIDSSDHFQVRQATQKHTCTVDERRSYHRLATTQVIGEIMQSHFVGVRRGPNAAAIRKILLDEYHINISYWKAWRAREVAMELSMGSMAGSYALLPTYIGLLQQTNPGSVCFTEHVDEPDGAMRFKYQFIAYAACVKGYQYMRKVVVVDGTSMKARYGGCLLTASCQDGNFQIFPLAFAVVDSENDDSWEWFFRSLSTFVHDTTDLVFISDRHNSIYTGLRKVYTEAHHSACTVHLWRNVRHLYKPQLLAGLMSSAARAFVIEDFNKKFLEIQRVNPGCAAYLVDIGFTHWTRVHSQGKRYNIMDSNIAESWNQVLKEAREYPLICMLEYIRTTVMEWFAIRRARSARSASVIASKCREIVEENFESAMSMAVRPISDFEFQVQIRSGECFTVKLVEGTCSCNEFQCLSIPCPHVIAAATRLGVSIDTFVDTAYFEETIRHSYEEKIYPIPSVGGHTTADAASGTRGDLNPPRSRRPPGRPKKIRILSRGEFKVCFISVKT
ncbi:PREDICTED: uncharacterized protein LOC109131166 [Camelina sativa]|uniref:Uncharacterized protein LOC109131166 n=1 Tax=Camelina sativa TaxID=90675 RepID=A0ABM1REE6_CAMSA|nr:PREDICTED: uncharacterized protein LOC109131166 [Camelina sativa]